MPSHTVNATATSTRRRKEIGGRVARCGHPTKATFVSTWCPFRLDVSRTFANAS
jgi:hypothetical protein